MCLVSAGHIRPGSLFGSSIFAKFSGVDTSIVVLRVAEKLRLAHSGRRPTFVDFANVFFPRVLLCGVISRAG